MAWNSTPAIQQQLCSISPPRKGTFWGTSQTWDTASPQGKDTKGILFTKRCCHFFLQWSWIQLQISTKNLYNSHHLRWKKKWQFKVTIFHPLFTKFQVKSQNPTKRIGKKRKFRPKNDGDPLVVIQRCFLSEAQHIHSKLCKNMAPRILEKKTVHPLVGGHLTSWKGDLTIPKRSLWITRQLFFSFSFGGGGGQGRSWNMLQLGGGGEKTLRFLWIFLWLVNLSTPTLPEMWVFW